MSRRSTVFVGNLPPDVQKPDIEEVFEKYGKIARIDLKTNGPDAPIAFVEFEDSRDVEDAIRGRDGYDMDGYRLRCDVTRGNGGSGGGGSSSTNSYRNGGDRGIRGSRPPGPPSRRTEWRVRISGIPKSGSWQDLKDHMRTAGEVCFSEVFGDGTGAVEYGNYDDMRSAIKKLDDTKFKSHEGETSYVTVEEDKGGAKTTGIPRSSGGNRYGYRDRSPGHGSNGNNRARRSPSYSPPNRKGRSSPSYHDRSRSRSRSPRRNSPSPSPPRKSSNHS